MHEYSEMFKFNHKPFRSGRLDHLRNVCLQILSVAVYNHYKRIYYESVQKGNVKPTNEGYMVYKPDMFGDLLEHVEQFIAVLYPFSYWIWDMSVETIFEMIFIDLFQFINSLKFSVNSYSQCKVVSLQPWDCKGVWSMSLETMASQQHFWIIARAGSILALIDGSLINGGSVMNSDFLKEILVSCIEKLHLVWGIAGWVAWTQSFQMSKVKRMMLLNWRRAMCFSWAQLDLVSSKPQCPCRLSVKRIYLGMRKAPAARKQTVCRFWVT